MASLPNRQRIAKAELPPRRMPEAIAMQEGVLGAWRTFTDGNDQDAILGAARTLVDKAVAMAGTKASDACELMGAVSVSAHNRVEALKAAILTIHDDGADTISRSHTGIMISSIGRQRAPMTVTRTLRDANYPAGPYTVSWSPV